MPTERAFLEAHILHIEEEKTKASEMLLSAFALDELLENIAVLQTAPFYVCPDDKSSGQQLLSFDFTIQSIFYGTGLERNMFPQVVSAYSRTIGTHWDRLGHIETHWDRPALPDRL